MSGLSNEKFDALKEFVIESTKAFDDSHNHEHALKVWKNAMEIASTEGELDFELLTYASMLHDVRDHKYPDSISEEALESFLKSQIPQQKCEHVLSLIACTSFSKEDALRKKGLPFPIEEGLLPYLYILQDADRLEAIGQIGIERCITYNKASGGEYPHSVVQHCYDKLLRLYNEEFIRTKKGREIAKSLHEEIEKFVQGFELAEGKWVEKCCA